MNIINIINIIITLGTSPSCDGLGICNINENIENKLSCDLCIEAQLGPHENGLAVAISENKIPDKIFLKYFTTDFFIIKEDVVISKSLTNEFGYSNGYTIKKGKYKIYEDIDRIIIKF